MTTHPSILPRESPGTKELGGLQLIRSQKVTRLKIFSMHALKKIKTRNFIKIILYVLVFLIFCVISLGISIYILTYYSDLKSI